MDTHIGKVRYGRAGILFDIRKSDEDRKAQGRYDKAAILKDNVKLV